jgi:hypothetical protein
MSRLFLKKVKIIFFNKKLEYIGIILKMKSIKPIPTPKDANHRTRAKIRKQNKFLKIFEKQMGMVMTTCRQVGIGQQTYYGWLNKDKEFAERIFEQKEMNIDFAEGKMYQKIKKGEWRSIKFFLENHGKERGYSKTGEFKIHQTEGDSKEYTEQELVDILKKRGLIGE